MSTQPATQAQGHYVQVNEIPFNLATGPILTSMDL
jgi:hypothetical protein